MWANRSRRLLGACLAGCLGLLVGGCGTSTPAIKPAELTELKTTIPVTRLWTKVYVGEGGEHSSSLIPAVGPQRIYWPTPVGEIRAVGRDRGEELWDISLPVSLSGGLGLAEGELLLAGTPDGKVIALDPSNGSELWRASVASEVLARPRVAQGMAIVRTVDGKVVGLDAQTGKQRWVHQSKVPLLTLRGAGSPVIVEDKVIVGMANGTLRALNLFDGQQLWEAVVAAPEGRSELERMADVDADPIVRDGVVYAVAYQGRVVEVSLSSGRIQWASPMSSSRGMDADKFTLYITDDQGQIWGLDRRGGGALWKQDKLKGRGVTAPAIHGDYIVVGDFEGYLHWLSRNDGHLVARYRIDDQAIDVKPVVEDEVAYGISRGGVLDALVIGEKR